MTLAEELAGMLTSPNEPNAYFCFRSSLSNSGSEAGDSARGFHAWNNQGSGSNNANSETCSGAGAEAGNSRSDNSETCSRDEARAHHGRAKGYLCSRSVRV